MTTTQPNPGSPEAVAAGCTCSVDDNAHGRGFLMIGGDIVMDGYFVVRRDCPLHTAQIAHAMRHGMPPPASEPVCRVCNDTHWMSLGERNVPCTHCPTPCPNCQAGGIGAYCQHTPCSCACHKRTPPPASEGPWQRGEGRQ